MHEQLNRIGAQTRTLLLVGFGGLLILLAFTGFNTLSVLNRIQSANESIRLDYLNRDRLLEDIRSCIYLSGTYVRDLLFEPDPRKAGLHRTELSSAYSQINSLIGTYQDVLRTNEEAPFEKFRNEVNMYFDSLRPTLEWSAQQRKQLGYSFMQNSLLPRRIIIVRLADQISQLNQRQMNNGNQRIVALFTKFRKDLIILFSATLLGGILLATASIYRILRLEHLSELRYREVLQAREALRDLSARLVDVQETERRALARDLHDEVGQALSALLLALGNAAASISPRENPEVCSQLLETRRLAERTVAVVRDMCLFLRPSMLDDLGLLPALEWQAREVCRTSPLQVKVHASESLDELSDEQKTCIYRVVQEALRNVAIHAKARHAEILLEEEDEKVHLQVIDDGQGFAPDRARGLGILEMGERIEHLNGSFEIKSSSPAGTKIEVWLPKKAILCAQ